MKYTHTCSKCDSADVVEVEGANMNSQMKVPLGKWSMKSVVIDRYICAHCGYMEEFARLDKSFIRWAEKKIDTQGPPDEYV